MSRIRISPLNGSNSNLPDALARTSPTSFSTQPSLSGASLNEPGNLQGVNNIHGGYNMSNISGKYASINLGQGLLPNVHNMGRIVNSIGGPVGMNNYLRGSSSSNVANIPSLAWPVNLNVDFLAPHMVSVSGTSYSGVGVPQNQYPSGTNQLSYMSLINEPITQDSASVDLNDFTQLSGHPHFAGGSQGHLGGINTCNGAEYTLNTPRNDQRHDMTDIMQFQPLLQFQMPQSRFTNPYMGNEMISSVFQYPIVPDKYGMIGLLNAVKMANPSWTSLAMGTDLTTLGMNLNSPELLHKKFASPWSNEPAKEEPEYIVPDCYNVKQPPRLTQSHFAKFWLETLFYIFYSMPKDEAQLFAANELGWFYHREIRIWFMRVNNMEPIAKTNTHEIGSYFIFDPNTWQTIRKDNFVLQYDMIEKRPILPPH